MDRFTTKTNSVGEILLFDNGKYIADIEYKSSCDTIVGLLNDLDRQNKNNKVLEDILESLNRRNELLELIMKMLQICNGDITLKVIKNEIL